MADTKISALTAATAAAGANEFAINEAGTSKKVTGTLLKSFMRPTVIAGNSGTVDQSDIGAVTMQVLTAANTDIPSTTVVTQLTASTMGVGWWLAEYWIHWNSDTTTTGITFIIDHTGTATPFMSTRIDPIGSTTALATVGISHQTTDEGVVGNLPSVWAANADAGALGPNAGVTTATSVQFSYITALLLVTVTGDLLFRANSEIVSTVTRIKAGTCARYTRLS
jgi:hypothetical protein